MGMGDDIDLELGIIPQAWQCFHDNPDEIVEVYKNDSDHPNYLKCMMCGSEFPTIGDTDKWKPVWVDYDIQV